MTSSREGVVVVVVGAVGVTTSSESGALTVAVPATGSVLSRGGAGAGSLIGTVAATGGSSDEVDVPRMASIPATPPSSRHATAMNTGIAEPRRGDPVARDVSWPGA